MYGTLTFQTERGVSSRVTATAPDAGRIALTLGTIDAYLSVEEAKMARDGLTKAIAEAEGREP